MMRECVSHFNDFKDSKSSTSVCNDDETLFKVSPEGKCRRTTFFYSAVEFGSMDTRDGVSGIYPDSGCASLETRSVLLAMFS